MLHDAGARLARTLRSGDVIVRWDGAEFLMMLPDTDRDGTHRAAERLRRAIAAAPFAGRPETVELTVSVGWADWRGEDPSEFKLRVDALAAARRAGRGGDVVRPGVAAGRTPMRLARAPAPRAARPAGSSRAPRAPSAPPAQVGRGASGRALDVDRRAASRCP